MSGAAAWVKSHQQEATLGAGGAVVVVALALRARSKKAAAGPAAQQVMTPGGIGIPGTSASDIQNAVQDQINAEMNGVRRELGAEIGRIPAGRTGATGKTGRPGPVWKPPKAPKPPRVRKPPKPPKRRKPPRGRKPPAHAPNPVIHNPHPAPHPIRHEPKPAPKPRPKPGQLPQSYTVKAGDSLSGIANKYGMPLGQLEHLNGQIRNPNLIYAGQRVKL